MVDDLELLTARPPAKLARAKSIGSEAGKFSRFAPVRTTKGVDGSGKTRQAERKTQTGHALKGDAEESAARA